MTWLLILKDYGISSLPLTESPHKGIGVRDLQKSPIVSKSWTTLIPPHPISRVPTWPSPRVSTVGHGVVERKLDSAMTPSHRILGMRAIGGESKLFRF